MKEMNTNRKIQVGKSNSESTHLEVRIGKYKFETKNKTNKNRGNTDRRMPIGINRSQNTNR